jgi:ribosomal protein S6--L-glutamate ligase
VTRAHYDASVTEKGFMILSYQPCYMGDRNMICAGRLPDESDRVALAAAKAVILPQGCSPALNALAVKYCRHRFPNYDARFAHGGKLGQIQLFRKNGAAHPASALFKCVADFRRQTITHGLPVGFDFPLVFKFGWGGEGFTVYRIDSPAQLDKQIDVAAHYELSGQKGFLLQRMINTGGCVLRVVRIGELCVPYWRIAGKEGQFSVSHARGARIDHDQEATLQRRAVTEVDRFGRKTGINLAGFDLIFDRDSANPQPLMLEINYFFGRKGLGGSARFYRLLNEQIEHWLDGLRLRAPAAANGRCA